MRVLAGIGSSADLTELVDDGRPAAAALVGAVTDGSAGVAGVSAEAGRDGWRAAFLAASRAWLVAHVLIIAIQGLGQRATPLFAAQIPGRPPLAHLFNQLFTWDTAWYLSIGQSGYMGVPSDGVRFWPLLPLVTRAVSAVGIAPGTAILLVCWSGALFFGVLMYRLALAVGGDSAAARRAAWLSQLAPGAFVLVMGYTEALAGVCAAAYLLAIRQVSRSGGGRRAAWWHLVGFAAGFASGLVRPTGFLLAAAGGVEAVRGWRDPLGQVAARALTALAPLLGTGVFLWWSGAVYGDYLLPYSIQRISGLRGTVAQNPVSSALDSLNQVGNGAGAFTLIVVVVSVALLWECARRLPLSFTVWAALSVLAAITAPHFSSFARYASGIVPLLLVGGLVTGQWRAWAWTVGSSAGLCAYFAYQSFIGIFVP
jgi:hypothetical protein